jgi:hypothetical protein
MLAEIVSAKACEAIRGHFQALPASDRPKVMTGTFWINGCHITSDGTKVTFRLKGNGWQWIDEKEKKAGATFAVRQYVRFAVAATIAGTLDVGYDPSSHVASVWFSLTGEPEVQFSPMGQVDVDAQGAWSSILSAAASLVARSPEESAQKDAREQGATMFKKEFADGISVTTDLCTGLVRSGIGQAPRGKMALAGVGETKQIAVELQPGGLMIFGPQPAAKGMTIDLDVSQGQARLALVCNDQAEATSKAFLEGKPLPKLKPLAAKDVRGKATLRSGATACEVSLVVQPVPGASAPVVFTWQRPTADIARSVGGPLIDCADEPKPKRDP